MLDDLEGKGGTFLSSKAASSIYWLPGPDSIIEPSFLKCKKKATVFTFQDYWRD